MDQQTQAVRSGYERIIRRFVDWARAEDNIRAAMIIGSRARTEDHPADRWSDLDVVFFSTDARQYVDSSDWVGRIGVPLLTFAERTPLGGWERRVLFENGFDVDFAVDSCRELEARLSADLTPEFADLLRRGMTILLDKDGALKRLRGKPLPKKTVSPPGEADFLNTVNDFWYHAVWTAKHLKRGELWWAKNCCDAYLKHLLLRALEWHARIGGGPARDTWMRGRFLEEWADERAVRELPGIFAHYEAGDIERALRNTMDLFRRITMEIARGFGYPYPASGDQSAALLVDEILRT
jgi:aminoglycoside 6-adenylyltransferase